MAPPGWSNMAGKKATFMRSSKWRTVQRWMPRLLHELFPGPRHPWHFGPADQRAATLRRYCRIKGRELGGPAASPASVYQAPATRHRTPVLALAGSGHGPMLAPSTAARITCQHRACVLLRIWVACLVPGQYPQQPLVHRRVIVGEEALCECACARVWCPVACALF